MTRLLLFWGLAFTLISPLYAQTYAVKNSVMLSATLQEDPPVITLHWPDNDANATGFSVYRRTPGTGSWGAALATLPAGITEYSDNDIEAGNPYEYRVTKTAPDYSGYGYLVAGIRAPETEQRGVTLLVIDSTHAAALEAEIDRLETDLEGDGWIPKRIVVSPSETPASVKDAILAMYSGSPGLPHSIFLLGHVPVPYSGNINPDGHPDHLGAWPADGYYADADGTWTDVSVNNTSASDVRNDNVPGDGKFDQSLYASPLEMEIGRVDFAKLPAFSMSETELLRGYLDKDHAFRTGQVEVVERGLIQDNFGSYEEGFAQNGLRNFSAFFGADSVFSLDYQSTLQSESYLWSYACGAGTYSNCGGVINTTGFASDSLLTVFTMLFGSYFGDWDSNNNLLRAALASGQTLANAWAGRPNWAFHPMGLGATLGYCARLSQYNPSNSYSPGYGNRFVHIALMGDPTLRMHVVKPASNLAAAEDIGNAVLNWDASPDASDGYHLYRKAEGEEAFARVNDSPISGTTYTDSCLLANTTYVYMVRARKLESSGSGTYFNLSQGIQATVFIATDLAVTAGFDPGVEGDELTLSNTSQNAGQYFWDFGDGETSTEEAPTHIYQVIGDYAVTLIASNQCFADTASQTVTISVAQTGEATAETGWRIFPNPTTGAVSIQLEGYSGLLQIELFDLQGKMLIRKTITSGQSLDLSALPAGNYFARAEAKGKTWTGQIRKE